MLVLCLSSLLEMVRSDSVHMLKLTLAVSGCASDRELSQCLVLAARSGFTECVDALLAVQVSPDTTDISDTPVLTLAAEAGHDEIVRRLLRARCRVGTRTRAGGTALHYAARQGHDYCVAALLESDVPLDCHDSAGDTALIAAAKNCHRSLGVIRRLVDAKCDLDKRDSSRRCALHYASHKAMGAQLLLDAGADPDIRDADGNTPLILAAAEGFDAVVKCLVERGCECDVANSSGKTALHLLAMKNHWEGIAAIAQSGGDVDVPDANGAVPLWYAVHYNRPEAVKALLMANCHPDSPSGLSAAPVPLATALEKRLFDVAKLLVLAGCDLTPLYRWLAARDAEIASRPPRHTLFVDEDADDEDEEDEDEVDAVEWFRAWMHSPHSLQQLCRIAIRRRLGLGIHMKGSQLPLPVTIRDYVSLKEVEDHHIEGSLM